MNVGHISLIGFNYITKVSGGLLTFNNYSEAPETDITDFRTVDVDYKIVDKVFPQYINVSAEKEGEVNNYAVGRIESKEVYKALEIKVVPKFYEDIADIREIQTLQTFNYLGIRQNNYIDAGIVNDTSLVLVGYADFELTSDISGYRGLTIQFHSMKPVAGF